MTKPLSEMTKEELTAELNASFREAPDTASAESGIESYVRCLVLIEMLKLKEVRGGAL